MSFSLITSSESVWSAIIDDIRKAQKSIDVELFIIDVDDIGLSLINTLRQKSREGVKVRLLVDAGGSFALYLSNITDDMKADGVHLSFFNHILPWYPKNIKIWYFRNHRRSITIDGSIVYLGGTCFSNNMKGWHDSVIRLEHVEEAVKDIGSAYDRMWVLSEKTKFSKRHNPEDKEWLYLTNAPVPGRRYFYRRFIKLIKNAKKEIFLTTPYFIPDTRLMRALRHALERGVAISLLMPKASNHPFADRAGDFQKEELMRKGMRLYLYDKTMIHDKSAVFDHEYAAIGSMNLDHIGLLYNFENGIISSNQDFVTAMRDMFENDTNDLAPISTESWHARPLKQKIYAYLIWPFRKLL